MRIERDEYLNDLIVRMGNGAIKAVTGILTMGLFDFLLDPASLEKW